MFMPSSLHARLRLITALYKEYKGEKEKKTSSVITSRKYRPIAIACLYELQWEILRTPSMILLYILLSLLSMWDARSTEIRYEEWNEDFNMRILVNVHLFGHLYRYVILCDSGFYLQQFPIFFLSLGMYITLLPIRLTNAIIIFGTFIHAHNHVIVSLIILANSFFSFFSLTARVYICHWHSLLCNMNGQQFVIIIFLFLLLLLFLQTNIPT
jgi:hypothetical protein